MRSWSKVARRIRVPVGFAFAALYVWLARPTRVCVLLGSVLIVIGLIIRALASGYVKKNEQLTMSGPYAYTRNPLYLGSLILAVGFALAARSWWITVVLIAFFFAIYLPVIRSEEEFLRASFPEFAAYADRVPRLIPRFRAFHGRGDVFSWALYCKHREYNAGFGSLAMIAVLLAKLFSSR